MVGRLTKLGYVLIAVGLVFVVAAGVAYSKTQEGYDSLSKFSEAQNVTLSYNEDGQLIDRGTVEGAQAIMSFLENEWGYAVVGSELDPNDPLVNTGSEYMFQMATVTFHVLHGTQTVILTEDVEYNGESFPAGTYEVAVDGRYWTDFDRMHPLEGPARSQAWTGTAHGFVGELGVGTVTHSTLKLALALAGLFAGVGLVSMLGGGGLIWAARGSDKKDAKFVTDAVVDKELSNA
mgnify:CR=1 FL=1